jgi:predicted membrane protein
MDTQNDPRSLFTPRLIIGAAIALMGVVLTLDRVGLLRADYILRLWPLVVVLIGYQIYTRPRRERGHVAGLVWMGIGGFLLLNTLGITRVHVWDLFWPAVLILLGTHLMLQTTRRTRTLPQPVAGEGEQVTIVAVLSGVKRSVSSVPFSGADVTTFMGGAVLDLRQALLASGATATIDVFAVMGGCEIYVPTGWTVATPVVAVMGGIEDKRLAPLPDAGTAAGGRPPEIVINGFVMMGGIQIKS